jgi:large subunit ribosomal protein L18
MKFKKEKRRKRIHHRIRKQVNGTPQTPRLCVYRSNKEIYCQLVDDVNGRTLVSASSREKDIVSGGTKSDTAKLVGQSIARKAQELSIKNVVFDRGGYLYHGRVKALAEGARENGLKF